MSISNKILLGKLKTKFIFSQPNNLKEKLFTIILWNSPWRSSKEPGNLVGKHWSQH